MTSAPAPVDVFFNQAHINIIGKETNCATTIKHNVKVEIIDFYVSSRLNVWKLPMLFICWRTKQKFHAEHIINS